MPEYSIATLKAVADDAFDRGGMQHFEVLGVFALTFGIVVGHFQGKLKVKAHPKAFIFGLVVLALLWADVLSRWVPMLLAP
jgi:hypothetical protein